MRLRDVGRFACRAPVLFMKKKSGLKSSGRSKLGANVCLEVLVGRPYQKE